MGHPIPHPRDRATTPNRRSTTPVRRHYMHLARHGQVARPVGPCGAGVCRTATACVRCSGSSSADDRSHGLLASHAGRTGIRETDGIETGDAPRARDRDRRLGSRPLAEAPLGDPLRRHHGDDLPRDLVLVWPGVGGRPASAGDRPRTRPGQRADVQLPRGLRDQAVRGSPRRLLVRGFSRDPRRRRRSPRGRQDHGRSLRPDGLPSRPALGLRARWTPNDGTR